MIVYVEKDGERMPITVDELLAEREALKAENAKLLSILKCSDFTSLWVGAQEMRMLSIGFGKWIVVFTEDTEWDAKTGERREWYLDHGGVWRQLPDGFEMGTEELYAGFHFDGPIAAWDAMENAPEVPETAKEYVALAPHLTARGDSTENSSENA